MKFDIFQGVKMLKEELGYESGVTIWSSKKYYTIGFEVYAKGNILENEFVVTHIEMERTKNLHQLFNMKFRFMIEYFKEALKEMGE